MGWKQMLQAVTISGLQTVIPREHLLRLGTDTSLSPSLANSNFLSQSMFQLYVSSKVYHKISDKEMKSKHWQIFISSLKSYMKPKGKK